MSWRLLNYGWFRLLRLRENRCYQLTLRVWKLSDLSLVWHRLLSKLDELRLRLSCLPELNYPTSLFFRWWNSILLLFLSLWIVVLILCSCCALHFLWQIDFCPSILAETCSLSSFLMALLTSIGTTTTICLVHSIWFLAYLVSFHIGRRRHWIRIDLCHIGLKTVARACIRAVVERLAHLFIVWSYQSSCLATSFIDLGPHTDWLSNFLVLIFVIKRFWWRSKHTLRLAFMDIDRYLKWPLRHA